MAPYKHPQFTLFWYIRGSFPDGKRYVKSTGIPIARPMRFVYDFEAKFLAAYATQAKAGVALDAAHMPPCIESLRLLHMERLANKKRHPGTLKNYGKSWANLAAFFDHIDSFRHSHQLQAFAAHRLQTSAPPTVRKDIDILLGAFTYARDRGMPLPAKPERPDIGEKSHLPGANAGQYIEPEIFREFLRRLRMRRGGQAAADRLIICLLTGLRWGETNRLLSAALTEPRFETPGLRMIASVLGKNKRHRTIPLGPQAWAAWQRSVGQMAKASFVQFRNLSREMGLGYTLHLRDARVTFANILADEGIDVPSIDKVMGHLRGMPSVYQKAHEQRLAKVALTIETAVFGEPGGKLVVSGGNRGA